LASFIKFLSFFDQKLFLKLNKLKLAHLQKLKIFNIVLRLSRTFFLNEGEVFQIRVPMRWLLAKFFSFLNQILDVSTALQINHLCTKCHFYRVFHPVWWGDERSWGL